MARLLGYQGIAVVIEELLKIIKSVVCSEDFVLPGTWLKALSDRLPQGKQNSLFFCLDDEQVLCYLYSQL